MSDNTLPPHPVFRADGDQAAMIAAVLDCFPGQAGNPDVLVPIHPRVRQAWAATLIRRGLVLVPELMQEVPVATGAHPEAAWLQPHRWVKVADYTDEQAAQDEAAPPSTPAQQEAQARDMLRAIKPSALDQIDALTDPAARAAMAARLKPQAQSAIDAVQAALDQAERAKTKEESDGMDR